MAFRKKYQSVISTSIDLAVIQECENDSILRKSLHQTQFSDMIWYGNNPHKGLGIIAYHGATLELLPEFDPDYQYVLPIRYTQSGRSIILFAIWAMPHATHRSKDYIGQVWGALQEYEHLLDQECMIVGDLNSNAIWDSKRKHGNHSDVVNLLMRHGISSLYHTRYSEKHGQESQPTLYLLKQLTRPYHMDYCFVSSSLMSDKSRITVGQHGDWLQLSDHMPLFVTLE